MNLELKIRCERLIIEYCAITVKIQDYFAGN